MRSTTSDGLSVISYRGTILDPHDFHLTPRYTPGENISAVISHLQKEEAAETNQELFYEEFGDVSC